MDLTCLLLNNATYGMTGGQAAPTAAPGSRSTTTPGGAREPSFDACRLVEAAGASYVARGATSLPLALDDVIAGAIAPCNDTATYPEILGFVCPLDAVPLTITKPQIVFQASPQPQNRGHSSGEKAGRKANAIV